MKLYLLLLLWQFTVLFGKLILATPQFVQSNLRGSNSLTTKNQFMHLPKSNGKFTKNHMSLKFIHSKLHTKNKNLKNNITPLRI